MIQVAGQREERQLKSQSPRQHSNLLPPQHWSDALHIDLLELLGRPGRLSRS